MDNNYNQYSVSKFYFESSVDMFVCVFVFQYGLYSAFMGCFVYTFLGTSKDITLGPTAIMSLMTAAFASSDPPGDPTYALVLTLVCGVVQFVMGLFHLGKTHHIHWKSFSVHYL